jgi:hypothetical protein
MLDVYFWSGTRSFRTRGLVDSGADGILANNEIAKALGINLKTLPIDHALGINGIPMDIRKVEIELEIDNFKGSRNKTEVGFIESKSVGVLLGRKDFFDRYMIKFENYSLTFEIDLPQIP